MNVSMEILKVGFTVIAVLLIAYVIFEVRR